MRKPLEKKPARKLKHNPPPLGKVHHRQMTAKLAGRNVDLFERQAKAVRMAASGASYDQIAGALGYSDRGDAHRDVMAALDDARRTTKVEAENFRALRLAELDAMRVQAHAIRQAPESSAKERLAAMDRVVKIQEREARLLGLDAPTRSELSGPGGRPVQVDVGSLNREQLLRLAQGDFSVLYGLGASAAGEGDPRAGADGPARRAGPGEGSPN